MKSDKNESDNAPGFYFFPRGERGGLIAEVLHFAPTIRGIPPALRPQRGGCPAAVEAGCECPAALLRALPASDASACRTPGSLRLPSGLSFSLSCTWSCLCSRTLGFPNARSAVKQTYNQLSFTHSRLSRSLPPSSVLLPTPPCLLPVY